MEIKDWLWLASLAFAAVGAWQNQKIALAISQLENKLCDRIAKAEGEVKVLQSQQQGASNKW